ncbi:MAG: hypothetical protein ACM309_00315 [Bacillota bacterium]
MGVNVFLSQEEARRVYVIEQVVLGKLSIAQAAQLLIYHAKKHTRRRRSRDRMPALGMLVQCDASPFAWFESRGPWATLHGAIDDATSKVLGLFFRPTEDLLGYLQVLGQVMTGYGLPVALYSDQHTIFFSPNHAHLALKGTPIHHVPHLLIPVAAPGGDILSVQMNVFWGDKVTVR